MNELEEIGLRIKNLREQQKMNQEELAIKVGYTSKTSINKIEKGKVDLPQSKIKLLAKALNTTPTQIMGWEENNLTNQENKLIAKYRNATSKNKQLFSQRLNELLRSKGITRKQFSEDVQINKNQVKRWEANDAIPNRTTLTVIANYFGVSVAYLKGETDDPTPENKKISFMTINKELLLSRIEKLCKEKGIKPNTAYIESGAGKNFKSNMSYAEPTLGKISLLASYFGVSVAYLKGEMDDPTPENKKVSFDKETQSIIFSSQEENIVIAYRNADPVTKRNVNKLLDIEEEQFLKYAARSGDSGEYKASKEEIEKIKNLPDVNDDI